MASGKLIDTPTWRALVAHQAKIKDVHLRQLFADDPGRADKFTAEGAGIQLDYSKNRIDREIPDFCPPLRLWISEGKGKFGRYSVSTGSRLYLQLD